MRQTPLTVEPVGEKQWTPARIARIALSIIAVTGVTASSPYLTTVLPILEQIANGLGWENAVMGALAGYVADLTRKKRT